MHQINLSDGIYQDAQRRAAEAGFASVEEYIVDLLQGDLESENLDRFFTHQRLAHIGQAAASISGGSGLTSEQADAELAKRRDEWLRRND
jgi:hypothetical protein